MHWYRIASAGYEDLEAFVDLFNEMPGLQMRVVRRDRDETYTNGPRIWVSTIPGREKPTHYIVDLGSGSFYVRGLLKEPEEQKNAFDRHPTTIFKEKGFRMQGDDLVDTKSETWSPPSEVRERDRWRSYW